MNNFKELDVIPTLHCAEGRITKEEVIADILEQNKDAGFTRFLLHCPTIGYLNMGFAPIEVFENSAKTFKEIKDAVAPHGIEVGWWYRMTVNSGPTPDFQRIVRPNGENPPYSNCPLCKNLRRRMSESVARFAEIGEPDFIFFEDDFSIGAQTYGMGCFCEAHLAEFARREGKRYEREELVAILKEKTPEAFAINRRWRELIKDSLVGFASAIRKELDKKSPHIPIGHMQPGSSDTEGDSTEAVARAFAGPNHTPHARFFSCLYGVESPNYLPEALFNPLYKIQHTGENFLFYLEGDPWPHTRFFRSGKYMRACFGAVYSYAYDGATFNNTVFSDNQNEEKTYTYMYNEEKVRFNKVASIAKQCKVNGIQIEYDPFFSSIYGKDPLWLTKLSLYGIPITTNGAKIAFWDEAPAKYMDHESVMRALSGGLFLDGAAAKALYDRGYGEYLGVDVGDQICKKIYFNDFSADTDPFSFDMGAKVYAREKYREVCGAYSIGTSGYGFSPTGVKGRVTLPPNNENCEIVADLFNSRGECVTVASTIFKNSLGGTVIVFGAVLGAKYTLSYREQKLIQYHLLQCSDDIAFAVGDPNLYLIMNEAKNPEESGFLGMLTVSNLCEDDLKKFSLHIPSKWLGFTELLAIGQDGELYPVKYELDGQTLTVKENLNYLDPISLVVK